MNAPSIGDTTYASRPEPPPTPAPHGQPVLSSIIRRKDLQETRCAPVRVALEERALAGLRQYGVPLTTFNGRDALVDLYQEILDAIMYAEQARLEEEQRRGYETFESMSYDHLCAACITTAIRVRALIERREALNAKQRDQTHG